MSYSAVGPLRILGAGVTASVTQCSDLKGFFEAQPNTGRGGSMNKLQRPSYSEATAAGKLAQVGLRPEYSSFSKVWLGRRVTAHELFKAVR